MEQIRKMMADTGNGNPPPTKPPGQRSVPVEPVEVPDEDTVEGGTK